MWKFWLSKEEREHLDEQARVKEAMEYLSKFDRCLRDAVVRGPLWVRMSEQGNPVTVDEFSEYLRACLGTTPFMLRVLCAARDTDPLTEG